MMFDCVAIVSGGMDSVTLLHYLIKIQGYNPAIISFKYGQKHEKEIICARLHAQSLNCEAHLILDLAPLGDLFSSSALVSDAIAIPGIEAVRNDPQPVTYVPNRNMIFLALAVAYAESHNVTDVFYGAQQHDMYGYWDTTATFLTHLNAVYALNRKAPVRINAPFVNYSKAEILRLGLELSIDFETTWSCYEGQELSCGRCPTCTERLQAFESMGIKDPLLYAAPQAIL